MNKQHWGRPPSVKFKNTARVRVIDPILGPTIRGDVKIIDEFSSKTGGQGAPPERDKMSSPAACLPTPDMALLMVQLSNK